MSEDQNVVLARIAERAERYDEMSRFMTARVEAGGVLSSEERDMFSAAFKNSLSERRVAVRVAVQAAAQEAAEGRPQNEGLALGYKSKVVAELQGICNQALQVLKSHLVPTASDAETKSFFLKMQGDYYRYLAEFADPEAKAQAAAGANEAYTAGMQAAEGLSSVHPVRLGLSLNYSVFQHEVNGDTKSAEFTASNALHLASQEIGSADEAFKNDALLTMQLLQDNLELWKQ
mmetsp:Transcript_71759/g.149924  ORF Transcript_71759/g.149924 Transcript_71759/m.149924 type:complete len:232 (-) Transcript_71759:137-832(-)